MPKLRQIVRGISLNWVALATSLVVGFFLSPFVVHQLGNIAYGIWTLVVSLISYMGLLDLGLRGAVTRFVSREHTQGKHAEASRAVSAAFWIRLWIGLAAVALSLVLSGVAPAIFRIPAEMIAAARWAIVVTAISFAMTLVCGVFGGVLAALHRFDQLSGVSVLQTVVRAAGVVLVLKSGYGIVALALWELAAVVMANLALTALCFRAYPDLRISLRRPDTDILRSLWAYSIYVFLINMCIQVIYYTDNLVVGAFISAEAVTFFAIGGTLIEYLRQLVASLTMTFTPLASNFEAEGQHDRLRQLLIHGTRAAMFVALPIELALFFRGPTFIGLWMGEQYASASGQVLQVLLLAQAFAIANYTSGGIAYGMEKHRPVALWAMGEAVANLVLSILLVRQMGLIGVAWGTVIPSLITSLLLWPRYVTRILEMSLGQYLWQSWGRPTLAAVPFGVACWLTDRFWHPTSLLHFFLQIAAVLPLYLLGMALCFWKDVTAQLRTRTRKSRAESRSVMTDEQARS